MTTNEELARRAHTYGMRHGLRIANQLGSGVHGIVFLAKNQAGVAHSAVKCHEQENAYQRERDVYLRLKKLGVKRIRECEVPELLHHDDNLLVIEMTVVSRPFVLDFAGAYLDRAPDFSDEVIAEWQAEKKEQFGARWKDVRGILAVLAGYGIHMIDVNPGNISFGV
jgi:hypothetical protein